MPDSSSSIIEKWIKIITNVDLPGFQTNVTYNYKCSNPNLSDSDCFEEFKKNVNKIQDYIPSNYVNADCPTPDWTFLNAFCAEPITNQTSTQAPVTTITTTTVAPNVLTVSLTSYNSSTGVFVVQANNLSGQTAEFRVNGLADWSTNNSFTIPSYQRDGSATFVIQCRTSTRIATPINFNPVNGIVTTTQTTSPGQIIQPTTQPVVSNADMDALLGTRKVYTRSSVVGSSSNMQYLSPYAALQNGLVFVNNNGNPPVQNGYTAKYRINHSFPKAIVNGVLTTTGNLADQTGFPPNMPILIEMFLVPTSDNDPNRWTDIRYTQPGKLFDQATITYYEN